MTNIIAFGPEILIGLPIILKSKIESIYNGKIGNNINSVIYRKLTCPLHEIRNGFIFFYKYTVIHRLDRMSTEPAHHITIASSTRK
jgi:hypothetical protein